MIKIRFGKLTFLLILWLTVSNGDVVAESDDTLTAEMLTKIKKVEKSRIETIQKVVGSVIAIYGEERQGGGSGVIIDPSGIALTNHHVIMGAGTKGWGGLADGELYRWELVGTDPGGDVSVIQMKGKDKFPFTPLADSDTVQVGDWSLAMGNPFVLSEDQAPTVTLGIVSGIKRYQPGAGLNELVYGNCIQTDSSINPGNSGGPLFNMAGKVIGINGRGSFKERGRVNVGLGYAISSNQIKNFIPDLLATKLVEHGTLDANFEDRKGKVLCSNLYEDSRLYKLGIRPGDELLEFEGETIFTANQFTNLICTLPEDWPAKLVLRKKNGKTVTVHSRLYGLPYKKPPQPKQTENEQDQTPEQREKVKRQLEMVELLSAQPGTIRLEKTNQRYAKHLIGKWNSVEKNTDKGGNKIQIWRIQDTILKDGENVGTQEISLVKNGEFHVVETREGVRSEFLFRNGSLFEVDSEKNLRELSLVEFKLCSSAIQAAGISAANEFFEMTSFGKVMIDGSGKALNRKSYRMKCLDSDDDSFYFWLSMQNKNSDEEVKLLKAGADINCEHDYGGITFDEWKLTDGISLAKQRRLVKGLAEEQDVVYSTNSVSSENLDETPWKDWTKSASPDEQEK